MTVISPALLQRFDVAGPRYTSYPTADRFVEAFGCDEYSAALAHRRSGFVESPTIILRPPAAAASGWQHAFYDPPQHRRFLA